MRYAKVVGVLVLAVFVAIQWVPSGAPRSNPEATGTIAGPDEVVDILRASCFDCHSNQTHWPWYAYVAPMSWLVTEDVAGARSRMNFSEWEELRDGFKKRFSRRIVERIERGEMPLRHYVWLHRDADITPEQLTVLRAWRDEINGPTEQQ